MDIVRLLQPLERFPNLEVIQYYVIISFLQDQTMDNLQKLLPLLDNEIKNLPTYSQEQAMCIRYLFRDWSYQFIEKDLSQSQVKRLFLIDNEQHKPGFFLNAIDFAKRNPKENQALMQFGFSLLLQMHKSTHDIKLKSEAIEQLLSSVNLQNTGSSFQPGQHRKHIIISVYSISLIWICIHLLTNLHSPLL